MTVQGNDIAIRGPAMRTPGFWRDETLLNHLARAVARSPDKTAIVACRSDIGTETRLSYAQIDYLSSRLAAALRARGIGRGSGIVGHLSIDIGNDVWTGHHVYITDQNHGYENIEIPISQQTQTERPVSIGDGSWLGAGVVVLPGATIGKHVAVGANSVVTGMLPDFCVAVGAPARIIKQYSSASGWKPADQF